MRGMSDTSRAPGWAISNGTWGFLATPTKRCPERRDHYAHEWYDPLRNQCPGGPDETCLCTGRPPCWVCEARAKQDALEAGMREVQDRINRLGEKLATDGGQDHHQTHGNEPVSAEEREMDHGDHDGATGAERGEG